jgi:SHAQKYF class myb-like DNA-binding protein
MLSFILSLPPLAGRWTDREHAVFVRGLLQFGKDWSTISVLIRTRTVVQVRTHAQKYFIKLKKYKEANGDGGLSGEEVRQDRQFFLI